MVRRAQADKDCAAAARACNVTGTAAPGASRQHVEVLRPLSRKQDCTTCGGMLSKVGWSDVWVEGGPLLLCSVTTARL